MFGGDVASRFRLQGRGNSTVAICGRNAPPPNSATILAKCFMKYTGGWTSDRTAWSVRLSRPSLVGRARLPHRRICLPGRAAQPQACPSARLTAFQLRIHLLLELNSHLASHRSHHCTLCKLAHPTQTRVEPAQPSSRPTGSFKHSQAPQTPPNYEG